jgi:phage tail-like protein
MAIQRARPYVQFNFLLDLGEATTHGPQAGFQECSNIGVEMTMADYGKENKKKNNARKITGLNKSTDVTLKRGIIGFRNLNRWLNDIRDGNRNAHRNVLVHLQNEDHTAIVQTWKLKRARIIKHISGPMNAKGTDVAIEELTLACEQLEMEQRPRQRCDVR